MTFTTTITYRRIGAGNCGTVWSQDNSCIAIKREDGGRGRSLLNDHDIHQRILQAYADQRIHQEASSLTGCNTSDWQVLIPACRTFIPSTSTDFWTSDLLSQFPQGLYPCAALISERIPPLSLAARTNLITKYCPPAATATITASRPDTDCLVRPYLGRRQLGGLRRSKFFSLRNFPLHLDQMESLGLEVHLYATIMGRTLALLHWGALVDGADIEFVLGSPRPQQSNPSNEAQALDSIPDRVPSPSPLGDHRMWLLDFDVVRPLPLPLSPTSVDAAVKAFFGNDPYYPRPPPYPDSDHSDAALWETFRAAYLEAAAKILDEKDITYSTLFIQNVELQQVEVTKQKSEIPT